METVCAVHRLPASYQSSGSHLQAPWEELKCQTAPCSSASNEAGFEYCTPCEETSSGQAQNWKFYFLGKFQILRHVVSKSEVSVFGGHFHHTVVTIG